MFKRRATKTEVKNYRAVNSWTLSITEEEFNIFLDMISEYAFNKVRNEELIKLAKSNGFTVSAFLDWYTTEEE
jgi:hypothetical protein